jgi:16S rRNA (guanine(966)-N(2))-methyltransferase RsmD
MSLRIIGGVFKGRTLKSPNISSTRPTQGMLREAVFNICQNRIEGAHFLDLFAGSGAMGIEALSRGAAHATFVEKNRQALGCIKENLSSFQLEKQSQIIPLDAQRALQLLAKQEARFDLIYVDPPYDIQTSPFLDALAALLSDDGLLFIEERSSPKTSHKAYVPNKLTLKDSRRFGIALLHQYRVSDKN